MNYFDTVGFQRDFASFMKTFNKAATALEQIGSRLNGLYRLEAEVEDLNKKLSGSEIEDKGDKPVYIVLKNGQFDFTLDNLEDCKSQVDLLIDVMPVVEGMDGELKEVSYEVREFPRKNGLCRLELNDSKVVYKKEFRSTK